ncbi:hypothetical protein [Streptomyces sp. NPDC005435]|uniref:hypothetical protein n=1 Tax=Streptomyces sp. NPDC005435 TaxID=3154464 RepID=UPI003451918F
MPPGVGAAGGTRRDILGQEDLLAPAGMIDAACCDLDDALIARETELTEGDISRPGHAQSLRPSLGTDWNRLVRTAQRFTGHPDHLPRLRYCCVEHAEFVDHAMGDATDSSTLHSGGPRHDG